MSLAGRLLPAWTRRGMLARRLVGRVSEDPGVLWQQWASRHPDVFFVQIGSHNGRDADPLCRWIDRHPRWRGVMVEPIQYDELAAFRGGDARLELVRAAVTDHDGTVGMFEVVGSSDAAMLSSVDRKMIGRIHDNEVREVEVPAVTWATLTRDRPAVDVLHIDTEGHDAVILDQVELPGPAVILYESEHLSLADRTRCEDRLRDAGYRVVSNEHDTLGLR